MANEIRRSVLETLRAADFWISGERLSARFAISRVAVWKHIKALLAEGYPIESGRRGYRLGAEFDTLSSLEFTPAERIVLSRELSSTMDEAARRMRSPVLEPDEFVILADHQSAGIGRGGAPWSSPSGGVYATFVLNRTLPLSEASLLPLRGAHAALESLAVLGIDTVRFRWPGDIMVRGEKIGGVLEEYHVRGGRIRWYALGVGVHVNDAPDDPALSSVLNVTGVRLDRRRVVTELRERWERACSLTPTGLRREISDYADFLHKSVRIRTVGGDVVEGTAESLDEEGMLRLASGTGTVGIPVEESVELSIQGER